MIQKKKLKKWYFKYHYFGIFYNRKIFKYHYFGIYMEIERFFNKKLASRIIETELTRYVNFFENTHKENLEHCRANLEKFPRWSIISGYYAMHDITKLFLAKKFMIKVDFNVHKTTLQILKEIIKNKEILRLLKKGYKEFIGMANDLAEARKERTRAQYYTGTEFMKEKYKEKAENFLNDVVIPYLNEMNKILR